MNRQHHSTIARLPDRGKLDCYDDWVCQNIVYLTLGSFLCLDNIAYICGQRDFIGFAEMNKHQKKRQEKQLIKTTNIGQHEETRQDRKIRKIQNKPLPNHSQCKTKEKQPTTKVGVTELWSNIIANLKWRLFSIVASSLFVIYFIGLGSFLFLFPLIFKRRM